MKKTICIILVLLFLVSANIVSTGAVSGEKITPELSNALQQLDDNEKIEVFIHYNNYFPSNAEIFAETDRRTQLDRNHFNNADEVKDYYQLWRIVKDEKREAAALSVMEKMGVTFDDMTEPEEWNESNVATKGLPSRFLLSKTKINAITDVNEVMLVDVFDERYFERYDTATDNQNSGNSIAPEDKISAALYEKLKSASADDQIEVWIEVRLNLKNKNELEALAYEKCGLQADDIKTVADINLFLRTYRSLVAEDKANAIKNLLAKMDIDNTAVALENWDSYNWPCRFMLTTNEIYNAAMIDEVISIDLYHGQDASQTDVPIEEPALVQLADIDCNGVINIADATCLQKHLAEFYMDTPLDITADINKDGVISIGDVTEYQRWLAEIY